MLINNVLELSLLLVISYLRAGRADPEITENIAADESKDSIVVENSSQYGFPTTPWLPYYFVSPMMQPQYSSGKLIVLRYHN